MRFVRHTVLSFIAGKPGFHRRRVVLLERGLPAIQALGFVRHTALSFIVGKPHSDRRSRIPSVA